MVSPLNPLGPYAANVLSESAKAVAKTTHVDPLQGTILDRFTKRLKVEGLKKFTPASQKWLMAKLGALSGDLVRAELKDEALTTHPITGNMYTYAYFAKTDKQLPFWDRFPLIFVVEHYKDGFLGINLHYLPPKMRAVLIHKLMILATNKRFDKTTRLHISYSILKDASIHFSQVAPCIKRYLFTQMRSRMLYINPKDWEVSIYLPTAKWVRGTNKKVWADSKKRYW